MKSMAFLSSLAVTLISCLFVGGFAQLTPTFYLKTCPGVPIIVHSVVTEALKTDPRIAASLIRLHFHDCFVQGCDGSILLDNSTTIITEKDSFGNINSVRGFGVVDQIKTAVERVCPGVVSCADILTLASVSSVYLSGGPAWIAPLGRRDGVTANQALANLRLPHPFMTLQQLLDNFEVQGLNSTDLVALSGAHTFGRARCATFSRRLYNSTGGPDPNLNTTLLATLRGICPEGGNGTVLTNLDLATPNAFDKAYFSNLQQKNGLLATDQVLFSTGGANSTANIVNSFSADQKAFFDSFVAAMIKMGNISVLTGTQGEIRANCRRVNGASTEDGLVADY